MVNGACCGFTYNAADGGNGGRKVQRAAGPMVGRKV
jgi:hypothetical protein